MEIAVDFGRTINGYLGGEIAKFIAITNGKKFECTCGKMVPVSNLLAYPHDGGLKDKDNKGWWVYVKCPDCGHDMSFSHIPNRIRD